MIVELHAIQSFAPSNLNRDDTGSPKDCDFGGVRRARISSQSLKRAMRRMFADTDLVPADLRATRTRRIVGRIADVLAKRGLDRAEAEALAAGVLVAGGIDVSEGLTGALVFLGGDECERLADLAAANTDSILGAAQTAEVAEVRRGSRPKSVTPPALKRGVEEALGRPQSVDVALFGRMIAELPTGNIDAAAQVAHAISTHRVDLDFDYYTALDDLAGPGETGAAMVDTVEFNAATYYRYATVDVGALQARLADPEVVSLALGAFLRAAVIAEPTGKQNSFAAHNPPSYVLAVVRDAGAWSLANAFLRPVRASAETDLVDRSIDALEGYWTRLADMYGTSGVDLTASISDRELPARAGIERIADLDTLLARVVSVTGRPA